MFFDEYYAKWGRHKGKISKIKGCAMVALPSVAAYGALFVLYAAVSYLSGNSPLWWASLPLVGYALAPFICLWWVHDSDAWRDGGKQARLGLLGGLLAFTLIGQPWLGVGMWLKGRIYAEAFRVETDESKKVAEEQEAQLLGALLWASVVNYAIMLGMLW